MAEMTFSIAASGDDGHVEGTDPTYPPPAGETVTTTGVNLLTSRRFTFSEHRLTVSLLRFDTSALPDDAVVTAATLKLHVVSKGDVDNRSLVAEWYDPANWPVGVEDWTSTAASDAHAGTDITSIVTGQVNDFALQGLSNISKTGYTGLRLHVSGGQPTSNNDVTVAAFDNTTLVEPQLVVEFELALGGAISPSGGLTKQTGKALAGASSPSGGLTRAVAKALAGATSPQGVLTKASSKLLGGSVGPAGALSRATSKVLGGSISPSGSLLLEQIKALLLGGSISPTGTLTKATSKSLGGSVSPAGALGKTVAKVLAGATSPQGVLTKASSKLLGGSVGPEGALSRATSKVLAGSVSPAGTLGKAVAKALAGAIAPLGALATELSAAAQRVLRHFDAPGPTGTFDAPDPERGGFDPPEPE